MKKSTIGVSASAAARKAAMVGFGLLAGALAAFLGPAAVLAEEGGDPSTCGAEPLAIPNKKGDFDGDGHTDILWRHYQTGANTIWLMDGIAMRQSVSLDPVSTYWFAVGVDDFDGDGWQDILWRDFSTGANSIWFMNRTVLCSAAPSSPVSDYVWQIDGTGDFNGDSKADIVWRNYQTGANTVWLMDGAVRLGSIALQPVEYTGWQIEGSADFDFDGQTDLFWRNYGTGENTVWLMEGTVLRSEIHLPTLVLDGSSLNFVGAVGDYNGDGEADIVWRSFTTGANTAWLLKGANLLLAAPMSPVGELNWAMAGPR
ncbi:FG-GAP repeat domain-containing protein [Gloeobacter morelensis]|uniref:FG-GAP repeat domain-containing protein n=1 Tax=Gloeobacter morelensis TaxID=2907343 RepID=UPI001E510503|nr:VCBS repeat-containing protein [Gloeobacter morelensis]UFP97127.1 VCBS repeat-containing protein [Gloeobacter morelensis MG652769]